MGERERLRVQADAIKARVTEGGPLADAPRRVMPDAVESTWIVRESDTGYGSVAVPVLAAFDLAVTLLILARLSGLG